MSWDIDHEEARLYAKRIIPTGEFDFLCNLARAYIECRQEIYSLIDEIIDLHLIVESAIEASDNDEASASDAIQDMLNILAKVHHVGS